MMEVEFEEALQAATALADLKMWRDVKAALDKIKPMKPDDGRAAELLSLAERELRSQSAIEEAKQLLAAHERISEALALKPDDAEASRLKETIDRRIREAKDASELNRLNRQEQRTKQERAEVAEPVESVQVDRDSKSETPRVIQKQEPKAESAAEVQPKPTLFTPSRSGQGTFPNPPYPSLALRRHLEGKVVLSVTVDQNGSPVSVVVKESSNYSVLDSHSVDWVKNHWRWPTAEARSLLVPFDYRIR